MRTYFAFADTRSLVTHSLSYVKGAVLDLGAGNAKYKSLIMPHGNAYTTSDAVAGPAVDVVSDIEQTPFSDQSFDTVYCTQVFEHIPRPWLASKEIGRILKSDGVCIVSAPFLEAYHADPYDFFRYTVAGLESLFEASGFDILESGAYGRFYSVLVGFIRRLYFDTYKPQKKFTWRFVRSLVKLAGWLDKFCNNKIIYANVYVIARKK